MFVERGCVQTVEQCSSNKIVTIPYLKENDVISDDTRKVGMVLLFVTMSTLLVSSLMTSSSFIYDMVTILFDEHCSTVWTQPRSVSYRERPTCCSPE